jgi:SAM-dependent methyltransferase
MKKRSHRYILGDSDTEADRLRAQARLWDPVSRALFDRLKIKRGWKVLELGPGQGSLHLELRRRVRGPIDAVEQSAAFASRLGELCAGDGYGPGRIWAKPLREAPLPRGRYDLIFARWVFLFVADPVAHVKKLAAALKPGGLIAIQDYHRSTMALYPRPEDWSAFMEAEAAYVTSLGGDINAGGNMPGYYARAGLRTIETRAHLKTGAPGSPTWEWMSRFFLGVMPKLGDYPPFTPAAAKRLAARWRAAARRPESLLVAPSVIDVVGRKPR